MHKKPWTRKPMQQVGYLDQAAKWSKDLTRMKARGPGDIENAMRSIEREYGVDYWLQWRLRYRLSGFRDIGVSAYMALKNAYEAECERQVRKLRNDLTKTETITGPDHPAVRSAKTVLGED